MCFSKRQKPGRCDQPTDALYCGELAEVGAVGAGTFPSSFSNFLFHSHFAYQYHFFSSLSCINTPPFSFTPSTEVRAWSSIHLSPSKSSLSRISPRVVATGADNKASSRRLWDFEPDNARLRNSWPFGFRASQIGEHGRDLSSRLTRDHYGPTGRRTASKSLKDLKAFT